mmetsp:Transcript_8418/g.10193  ORF Transcript_8418/g.10193 Transcript_8418/m.10193 type:complete len:161 (+) Transcript_8418:419-901(+)
MRLRRFRVPGGMMVMVPRPPRISRQILSTLGWSAGFSSKNDGLDKTIAEANKLFAEDFGMQSLSSPFDSGTIEQYGGNSCNTIAQISNRSSNSHAKKDTKLNGGSKSRNGAVRRIQTLLVEAQSQLLKLEEDVISLSSENEKLKMELAKFVSKESDNAPE